MKTLPRVPPRVYGSDFRKVVESMRVPARAIALRSARSSSVLLARAYRPGTLHALQSTASSKAKEAFLHCWNTSPKPIQVIKAHIRQALPHGHQGKCPYCGLNTELSTFDHFLGKADVPELSFYYRNLVPSCYPCNLSRGTAFENSEQRVLYAYEEGLELIPQVLRAVVSLEAGEPVAEFRVEHPLPRGAETYAHHFTSLKLERRYRLWAATKIYEMRGGVRGSADAAAALTTQASHLAESWGPNDPTVALLLGVVAAPEVLEWLVE